MGLNPTQDQLRYFIEEVRGEDSTSGLVEYDRFEKVIVKALTDRKGEFLRDSETKLMRAFRAFDPENKGYIDGENLKVRAWSVHFILQSEMQKTGPNLENYEAKGCQRTMLRSPPGGKT
mmetsp:Transcript_30649/g.97876  ORF Transcript_30649/g.97876 Transcript_30649/m.97876 type:complete len:119 (+) Transcript_30649:477-833(+)